MTYNDHLHVNTIWTQTVLWCWRASPTESKLNKGLSKSSFWHLAPVAIWDF